jgi:RNA polymerase sigma-70 factor (ECF subfamily)
VTTADDIDFAEFYAHGYRRLVAELTLLTGVLSDAEDLAQEAYARAWQRWSHLHRFDQPQAWVRRVAFNKAVDRIRAHRRFLRLRPRLAHADSTSDLSPDWIDLYTGLKTLPPQQRAALILTAVSGLTTEEVARALDVPTGTVRSWLYRARTALGEADTPATTNPGGS